MPETGMSHKEYIEKKKQEFIQASKNNEIKEGLTWDSVQSQIISGIFLMLSHEEIDIYTTFFYDYAQMEFIKIAIYVRLPEKQLKKICNPKLSDAGMSDILLRSTEAKSIDGVKASIKVFMDELSIMKEEIINEKKELISNFKQEIEGKNEEIKRLKMTIATFNEELSKSDKKGGIFKKNRKEDLMKYITSSNMSPAQMELIRYAIEKNISEDEIRRMIKNNCSPEQMKAIITVIITKSAKTNIESKKKEEE